MTRSEKKASNSEITKEYIPFLSAYLESFDIQMYHSVLKGNDYASYISPVSGFVNILLTNGSATSTYLVNNTSYIIRSGENILHPIQEKEIFEWKNLCEDNIVILLFIPLLLLEEFQIKFKEQNGRFEDGFMTKSDQRLTLILNQLLDLHEHPNHLNKLRIQSLLIDILVHQIEGLYAENEKHEIIVNKNHYDKIQLAKKLIESDLSRNFTINELAKEVGTNEQYLKKYFKQYFGKTVMNYITDIKMEHAKKLILTGEYRVSDVARITGYKHSTHFTTAFKKYFGFIPNSLRYTFLVAHEGAKLFADFEGFIGSL